MFFLQINDKEFPLSDIEEGSDKDLSIQNQVCYILCLFFIIFKADDLFFITRDGIIQGGIQDFSQMEIHP